MFLPHASKISSFKYQINSNIHYLNYSFLMKNTLININLLIVKKLFG